MQLTVTNRGSGGGPVRVIRRRRIRCRASRPPRSPARASMTSRRPAPTARRPGRGRGPSRSGSRPRAQIALRHDRFHCGERRSSPPPLRSGRPRPRLPRATGEGRGEPRRTSASDGRMSYTRRRISPTAVTASPRMPRRRSSAFSGSLCSVLRASTRPREGPALGVFIPLTCTNALSVP
jgi:hypothetical protein